MERTSREIRSGDELNAPAAGDEDLAALSIRSSVTADPITPKNVEIAVALGVGCFKAQSCKESLESCYRGVASGFMRVENQDFGQSSRTRIAYYLFRNREGEAVGIGGIYQSDDRPADEFSLGWMAVGQNQRRKGYGQAIVEHLEADARQRGGRTLSVFTADTEEYAPALKLYERLGYTRDKNRDYRYGEVTEIVLVKPL